MDFKKQVLIVFPFNFQKESYTTAKRVDRTGLSTKTRAIITGICYAILWVIVDAF